MNASSLRLLSLYNEAEELALLMHEAALKNDWTEVTGFEVKRASIEHSIAQILNDEVEVEETALKLCVRVAIRIEEIEMEVQRQRDCYRNSTDSSSSPRSSPTLH